MGQAQAIQINVDAATPNVSTSVTGPRAAGVDQLGSAAESAVRQALSG